MSLSKRQQQKLATKNHILNISIDCYSKNGISSTTTAEIAKAAGVSHGTIFVHFPTQKDLLIAAVEDFGKKINKQLHDLTEKKSTLEEILTAHLSVLTKFEPFYARLISERRLLNKEIDSTYIMINSTVSFHIGLIAEKEMKLGKIKKIPIHLLYNTWIGLIHYYIINSDLFSDKSILKSNSKELVSHFLNLIKQ